MIYKINKSGEYMQKILISFAAILTFIFLLPFPAISQEIDATVTVNMDQVVMDNKVNVQTLSTDLQNYIRNVSYTENPWEGPKIPVDIGIVLSGGTNSRYSARLLIVSKRMLDGGEDLSSIALKLIDDSWGFEYQRFANLEHNALLYNEITTLIDYYMLIVVGFELDSYEELSGSASFDKARRFFTLGSSAGANGYGTQSSPGAFTRFNLINELTDARYYDLRKLIFSYYVDGLDKMATDKVNAQKTLADVISDIAVFKEKKMVGPSILLQAFSDAKNLEWVELFKDYPEKSVYDKLMYIDPSNSQKYREAKDSR
jgi:hypothetical protein